jgi:hypothetical protein
MPQVAETILRLLNDPVERSVWVETPSNKLSSDTLGDYTRSRDYLHVLRKASSHHSHETA